MGFIDPSARAIVADKIEDARSTILEQYRSRLRGIGSSIAGDERSLAQAVAQGGHVLDDVVSSVRTGEVRISEASVGLALRIGGARAESSIHPIESLRASSELFEVILAAAERAAVDQPAGPQGVADGVRALHHSIMTRIRWASGAYVSFLLEQLHEAQRVERRRMARELHDRVGSPASVVSRNLELSEAYVATDPPRSREKAMIAYQASVHTLEEIRQVATDLRLETEVDNLEKALRVFIDAMDPRDVVVGLTVSGDEGWMPGAVLDEVFAVVREALRNALVHAAPSTIVAQIDIAPHEIRAQVTDDGTGFDPDSPQGDGEGIASMRERVQMIGGRLFVSSRPGAGARVEVLVPLPGTAR